MALPQRPPSKSARKRKRFPWVLGVIVSVGFIAIFAFIILALLILKSQGPTQGGSIVTIISAVAGFVIGVFGLLLSFLQWHRPHHPQPLDLSEPFSRTSLQKTPLNDNDRLPPSDSPIDRPQNGGNPTNEQNLNMLIQARLQRGWTQADLAEKVGVATKTVARWEGG